MFESNRVRDNLIEILFKLGTPQGVARGSYRVHRTFEGNNYKNYKTTSQKSSAQLQFISTLFHQ